MIRVLFVCHGNICRSPMAEYIFKDIVAKNGQEKNFYISSAATSTEEIGNDMHYGTKEKLLEHNIPFQKHRAKQLKKEDYDKYDYIIGMENSNIVRIKAIVGKDTANKVYKLLDFTNEKKDIADPWYTGNFTKTYEEVLKQVNDIGMVITSQTKNLCPMDKKVYALRDVTGTTNSLALIAISIMSKKIREIR